MGDFRTQVLHTVLAASAIVGAVILGVTGHLDGQAVAAIIGGIGGGGVGAVATQQGAAATAWQASNETSSSPPSTGGRTGG